MDQVNNRKLKSCIESPARVGERELFDLPTSVVADLIAEQKELKQKDIVNFGLMGKATELKPLPEYQEKVNTPI